MIAKLLAFRRLLAARSLPPGALERLRNERLQATIRWAFETVPYYRELFQSSGVSPGDIRTTADLKHVPVTTKRQLVAAGLAATTSSGVDPAACTRVATTGSTTSPLRLYMTPREERLHRLVQFRTLLGMGLRPSDRMAVLSAVRPHRQGLHQRLGLYRSRNIPRFVSPGEQLLALQRFQPTVIWAYATVLREVLDLIDFQISRIVRPRAVISAGEVLDPLVRQRLFSNLEAELYHLYGSTEAGVIAGDCSEHQGLHVNSDQVVLEIVDQEGNGPVPAGRLGAAVVTTLNMRATPLIRYRTGDMLSCVGRQCPCGSPFPLIGVPPGREDDVIVLPSGRRLYPLDCDAFQALDEVRQYRFVQGRLDRIELQVRLRHLPDEETLPKIGGRVGAWLGEPIPLEIRVVDRFPDRKLKFRTIVSRTAQR